LTRVAFTPDGESLATVSESGVIRLLDPRTGAPQRRLARQVGDDVSGADRGYVRFGFERRIALDPKGRWLAEVSGSRVIRRWDLRAGPDQAPRMRTAPADVYAIAFSPDRRIVASGSDKGAIRFWNAETLEAATVPPLSLPVGNATGVLLDSRQRISALAFSPDGKLIAAGRSDGSLVVARLTAPRPVVLTGHRFAVSDIAFSGDGKILASGSADNSILLWNPERGRLVGALTGHTDPVSAIAFGREGRILASTGSDSTLRLWDTKTRRPLGEPMRLPNFGASVAFGPKAGGRLAVVLNDGTLVLYRPLLWETNLDELREPLCRVVGRNLDATEWAQFLPGKPGKTCDFG
jgi:dipeptidyl aminopeptidase/acylaminoacyl peptidase